MSPDNPAEELFRSYLQATRKSFERAPRIGKTEPDNRDLSALAVLRSFNPTQVELEKGTEAVSMKVKPEWPREAASKAFWDMHQKLTDKMMREGEYEPNATALRLIISHTRRPHHPLAVGWLGVEYDEEWGVGQSGLIELVHTGGQIDKVPGRSGA